MDLGVIETGNRHPAILAQIRAALPCIIATWGIASASPHKSPQTHPLAFFSGHTRRLSFVRVEKGGMAR